MDPTQSQGPSMEDHSLPFELLVVDIPAIGHGLQEEVIVVHNQMIVFSYKIIHTCFGFEYPFRLASFSCCLRCRVTYRLLHTASIVLRNHT